MLIMEMKHPNISFAMTKKQNSLIDGSLKVMGALIFGLESGVKLKKL